MTLGWIVAAILSFPVAEPATRNVLNVTAEDGTALRVLEYRYQQEPRPTVVLLGDRTDGAGSVRVDRLAQQLFHRGLDVVAWDRRGTGDSEGIFDFGRSDPGDLVAVIEAVAERQGGDRVGLLGLGTGGVAVLQGPHRSRHVAAVALYGVGIRGVPYESEGWLASLTSPHGFIGRLWWRARGIRLDESAEFDFTHTMADLSGTAAGMRGTASFIIAPGRFERVAVDEVRSLFDASAPPKQWLLAPGAGADPPSFSIGMRLSDFFRRHLD